MNIQPATSKVLPGAATVTSVTHWADTLFSFRVERPKSLRFRSGEFVTIGLPKDDGKPLLRAYSIASPSWDDELEFYSIKVPNGPLTSRLQRIAAGDEIILRPKPVGTLVLDALLPSRRLGMVCTGTGVAPFASLLRDPDPREIHDEVVLAHTCCTRDEPRYYPTTTREDSDTTGQINDHIGDGRVFDALGLAEWRPDEDRVMICGNLALNKDIIALCEGRGLREGAISEPGHFAVEKAFPD